MVTISNIAQRVLDENNYVVDDDISVVNLEYLIDNAVDYVNLMTGRSISNVSGNDLTADRDEIMLVKTLSALLIRAHLDRGPTLSVGGISVASVLADPQYNLFSKIIDQGVNMLRGRSWQRTR